MKSLLFILSGIIAQQAMGQNLPTIFINDSVSTHFVLSEPVQYVDLSTTWVKGELPASNILRIKPKRPDSLIGSYAGVVTIVASKYMVQYQMEYASAKEATKNLRISSLDGIGLLRDEISLSYQELKAISLQIKRIKSEGKSKSKANGMTLILNHVYTAEDYLFLDLSLHNSTRIPFDIDQIRFTVQDRMVMKSTNFQQLNVEPEFILSDSKKVKGRYRNIFAFKKFTFPDEKVLIAEFTEKMISGRAIALKVSYKDILKAKNLESY